MGFADRAFVMADKTNKHKRKIYTTECRIFYTIYTCRYKIKIPFIIYVILQKLIVL